MAIRRLVPSLIAFTIGIVVTSEASMGRAAPNRSVSTEGAGADASTSLTFVGPTVGLHWFATDSVSIDPGASVLYEAGGGSTAGIDVDQSGYAMLLGVNLSAWLGGAASKASSEPDGNAHAAIRERSAPPGAGAGAELHDLRVTFPLGGSNRLLFTGDPERGTSVDIVLIASDTEGRGECEGLTAVNPGGSIALGPFTKTPVETGTGTLVALTTRAPLSAIRALFRAKAPTVLEGCGQRVDLTDATRAVLGRFAIAVKKASRAREALNAESTDLSAPSRPLSARGGALTTTSEP